MVVVMGAAVAGAREREPQQRQLLAARLPVRGHHRRAVCFNLCYSEGLNAESCLGACKTRAAASPAAPAAKVLDELGTCLGVCHTSKHMKPTDHVTCELNCAQSARVAGPAPIAGAAAKTR